MTHHTPSRLAAATAALAILAACAEPAALEVRSSDRSEQNAAAKSASTATARPGPSATANESRAESVSSNQPASLDYIAFGLQAPRNNMDILSKLEGGDAQMGLIPAGGTLHGPLVEAARFEWEGPLNSANPRTSHAHIMTFAFRYPTDGAATEGYRLIVEAVGGAPDSAPRELISTIVLGDERAAFTRAGLHGREDVVYVWRRAAIVLAIIGHDGSDPSAVVSIALRMDKRAG